MTFSNADKQKHGQNAQDALNALLTFLKEELHLIKNYTHNYRIGKPGYEKNQFYAPFLITFHNEVCWIIFSSTTIRSDRIKGQQWDASNLKCINDLITKAILVYPDGIPSKEIKQAKKFNNSYMNKEQYSKIDNVLSMSELRIEIENYARNLQANLELAKGTSLKKINGRKKHFEGNDFEKLIANILINPDNLTKWQTSDKTTDGLHYNIFNTIINKFDVDKLKILRIDATTDDKDIGYLPSRGKSKTDILVELLLQDGKKIPFTISCKRSNRNKVSVHEYNADQFAQIIDPNNSNLKRLLNLFQDNPTRKDFGEDNVAKLTQEFQKDHYIKRLTLWALGGYYGSGNPQTQWAHYILTYDNTDNSISFHSTEEYCNLIMNEPTTWFGTPFSWTYPSKQRGKKIQLKAKIVK